MQASIEISLYPLSAEYKRQILDFIASLKVSEDIEVSTGELSTLITGDYQNIMNLVRDKLEMVFSNQRAVAVLKIVPKENN